MLDLNKKGQSSFKDQLSPGDGCTAANFTDNIDLGDFPGVTDFDDIGIVRCPNKEQDTHFSETSSHEDTKCIWNETWNIVTPFNTFNAF